MKLAVVTVATGSRRQMMRKGVSAPDVAPGMTNRIEWTGV